MRRHYHRLTAEEVEQAVAMYAEGMSTTAIGEVLGVSSTNVAARLRRSGVKIRRCGRQRDPEEPIAYEGGWRRRGLILLPTEPAR